MTEHGTAYVGFWARFGAAIIDTLLTALVTCPALLAVYGWDYFEGDNASLIAGPADLLISWLFPVVVVVAFWIYQQATPGKMVFAAKIVDAQTGGAASNAQLIGRYFAYLIAGLPLGLGFIWIAFDKRKQGWHDKLAGTLVVQTGKRSDRP